jgi:hypothetical protein
MTDMLHVSSSGTALANTGMANAFLTAAELADISKRRCIYYYPCRQWRRPAEEDQHAGQHSFHLRQQQWSDFFDTHTYHLLRALLQCNQ